MRRFSTRTVRHRPPFISGSPMFQPDQYQLLDFGDGHRLEQFGERRVSRATPAADGFAPAAPPDSWDAELSYGDVGTGEPAWRSEADADWTAEHRAIRFRLKTAPSGQVGLFPEQVSNLNWMLDSAAELEGLKAMNLFAYTGAMTMALAAAGCEVTHVDGAKSAVNWARENAALSGLTDAPIRWIIDDAMTFLTREIKRGKKYDILIADPPSFGRGPDGQTWKLDRDLPELLKLAWQLCDGQPRRFLISCHTPGFDPPRLMKTVRSSIGKKSLAGYSMRANELSIPCVDGRQLASGVAARISR